MPPQRIVDLAVLIVASIDIKACVHLVALQKAQEVDIQAGKGVVCDTIITKAVTAVLCTKDCYTFSQLHDLHQPSPSWPVLQKSYFMPCFTPGISRACLTFFPFIKDQSL